MKKFILAAIAAFMFAGCNDATRVFDSEIPAINRQTETLVHLTETQQLQTKALIEIAKALQAIKKELQ